MGRLTDLHYDLLTYIMIMVVKSSDGAANLARTTAVCRAFMKFAEDKSLLRAVEFDSTKLSNQFKLVLQMNGFIYECARAGNVAAKFLPAKMIVMSSTQLLVEEGGTGSSNVPNRRNLKGQLHTGIIPKGDTPAGAFMAHYMRDSASTSSSNLFYHVHHVNEFLCECSPRDIAEFGVHLNNYIDYFFGTGNSASLIMHKHIKEMCRYAKHVRFTQDLKEIKERLDQRIERVEQCGLEAEASLGTPQENEKNEALLGAIVRCGNITAVLRSKCREHGVKFNALFGASVTAEKLEQYIGCYDALYEEICKKAARGLELCLLKLM